METKSSWFFKRLSECQLRKHITPSLPMRFFRSLSRSARSRERTGYRRKVYRNVRAAGRGVGPAVQWYLR